MSQLDKTIPGALNAAVEKWPQQIAIKEQDLSYAKQRAEKQANEAEQLRRELTATQSEL